MSSVEAVARRVKVRESTGPVQPNKRRVQAVKLFLLTLGAIFALYPAWIIVGASFDKTNSLAGQGLIPQNLSMDNYNKLCIQTASHECTALELPINIWLGNSIKVSGISTIITLLLTTLAAYSFSRFRFAGRRSALLATLVIQVFPSILDLVAFYLLLQQLGKIPGLEFLGLNTHGGLILIYCGGALGANAWLMKGYFDTIPRELDEAAMVDGASHFVTFWRVILPLIRPIMAVIGLLAFLGTFNDYLLPTVLLRSREQFTLAVGLTTFLGNNSYAKDWGVFAAGALIGTGPVVILFLLLQTQLVSGLSQGAVKG